MSIRKSLMVFGLDIIVVVWETGHENTDGILIALSTLSTEIYLNILYEGLDERSTYHLNSLIKFNTYFNAYVKILKSFWCL